MVHKKQVQIYAISISILVISVIFGIVFGAVWISPVQLVKDFFTSGVSTNEKVFLYVRLPRVIATILSGAALSVAGVIIQAVLNNSLAAPNIIGVNAGAGFFTVLCIALFPSAIRILPAAAFLGALTAVLIVYMIAKSTGASRMTIILTGIAVSSLFNAATDTVIAFSPNVLIGITAFKSGGVSGIAMRSLNPAWIFILIGIFAAIFLSRDLDVLQLGDSTAKSLGMNVSLMRFVFLVISALLTGAAVSFSGLIGFVGLVVPHITKKIVGINENHVIIPISALLGAAFLTICDCISRIIFAPFELPLGIIVSYIGAPFFIYLIIRKKGGKHVD